MLSARTDCACPLQARYAKELPDAYERLILDVVNVRACALALLCAQLRAHVC
jgi:hypothetical protein